MNRGRAVASTLLVCAFVGLAGAAQAPAASDLGPEPSLCSAFAPVANCFYAVVSGTDTFTLSSHLPFVGENLSGTYRWSIGGQGNGEFASFGSVTVGDGGPGLKLLSCHGPKGASNAKAKWMTDKAFDVTEGHTTCKWRAKSAKDVSNIAPDADVHVTPVSGGGEPTNALVNYLNRAGNAGIAGQLPTYNTDIVTALATAIHDRELGGFVLAPVQTQTSGVDVLIAPADSRLSVDPSTGNIGPANPGQLIAPSALIGVNFSAGGFWGRVKTNTAGTFPTITQWLANTDAEYSFPGNAAPIYLTPGFGPLRYLNFGYGTDCI